MINETIKNQLKHVSIRKFKDTPVDNDTIKTLCEVANRTSSSIIMQASSVIRVTDKEKRKQISEVCMQSYVNDAPEFWIFIVDGYRNASIAAEQGCHLDSRNDMDKFFQGYTDAVLAAQNVLVAVESLGMGGVFFGSILNNPEKISEILELPEYTFPALGLGFGYPDQSPALKPRMDIGLKVFENKYEKKDNYLEEIKDYDEEMSNYYDMRDENRRVDKFSKQVVDRMTTLIEHRAKILNSVRRQGFELQLEYIPENEIKKMYKKIVAEVEDHTFEESKSGIRLDTKVEELFKKYPFVKDYLLSINPKFNKLRGLGATTELDMKQLSEIGEMPADSLIYMIESRISEE